MSDRIASLADARAKRDARTAPSGPHVTVLDPVQGVLTALGADMENAIGTLHENAQEHRKHSQKSADLLLGLADAVFVLTRELVRAGAVDERILTRALVRQAVKAKKQSGTDRSDVLHALACYVQGTGGPPVSPN